MTPTPQPTGKQGEVTFFTLSVVTLLIFCSCGFWWIVGYSSCKRLRDWILGRDVSTQTRYPSGQGPFVDSAKALIASIPVCPYEDTATARRIAAAADTSANEVGLPVASSSSEVTTGTSQPDTVSELCSVCLCELGGVRKTGLCKELRCGHCYHADCLDEWLLRSVLCPLCKHRAEPVLRSKADGEACASRACYNWCERLLALTRYMRGTTAARDESAPAREEAEARADHGTHVRTASRIELTSGSFAQHESRTDHLDIMPAGT